MSVKFKDYYETLAVAKTATQEEIKTAFRKLARLYHPDVAKNKVTAEEKFKEINEANEVLSDPEKRRRYDELGANWQDNAATAQPGGPQGSRRYGATDSADAYEFGGTGFSDFFEQFFSGSREGFGSFRRATAGPGEARTRSVRGQDIEADLLVTLEEALRGSERKVTLRRPSDNGDAERTDTYQVRIKPGMHEGQRIRLAAQGRPGYGGGAAGDLYLRVRLARHPEFSVQGDDLHSDLELAPWEAVLGTQIKTPILGGSTSLRIPPGTATGSQLRLHGLGLPRSGGERGDLYATIRIHTPPTVSAEERALWEQLSRVSTFNPRTKS